MMQMFQNGQGGLIWPSSPTWPMGPKMAQVSEWLRGTRLTQTAKNDPGGSKWYKMALNGPESTEWLRVPSMVQSAQNGPDYASSSK